MIQVGNPLSEHNRLWEALVSAAAAESILTAQAELQSHGAVVLNEATIQVHPRPCDSRSGFGEGSNVKDEEHFGPLLTAMVADDLDQAISIANQTKYGLAAGLLTDDRSSLCSFPRVTSERVSSTGIHPQRELVASYRSEALVQAETTDRAAILRQTTAATPSLPLKITCSAQRRTCRLDYRK